MAGGELLGELKTTEQTDKKVGSVDFKIVAEKYKTNPEEWEKIADKIMKIDWIKNIIAQNLNTQDENSSEFKASKALYEKANQQTQREITTLKYEKKVFELWKQYKELTDQIKTEITENERINTLDQINNIINNYRTAYLAYQKAIWNPTKTISFQQKEEQLIIAYKNNPNYKKLVENTLETNTYTIPWTPWQDITTTKTLLENDQIGLNLGETDFNEKQINDIEWMLGKIGDNPNMYIEITWFTDANIYNSEKSKKNNEDQYDQIIKTMWLEDILPTAYKIKNKPDIIAKEKNQPWYTENYILWYRRILEGINKASDKNKIIKNNLSKFIFSSEVNKEKGPEYRWTKIALKEEITEKTPPTPPTTTTETKKIFSPETIRKAHDYIKVFALNPNYGRTKDLDPTYPKTEVNRPYMFVQLSLWATTNTTEGPIWKVADINEIDVFNNLNKPTIDVTNTQLTNTNENVKSIYTFITQDDVKNIIDKNFIGNKEYTSVTNQLLMPIISNNKKNTEKALEEQKKSIEIIRYIGPKENEKDLYKILMDPELYSIIQNALDNTYEKIDNAIINDNYALLKKNNYIKDKEEERKKEIKKNFPENISPPNIDEQIIGRKKNAIIEFSKQFNCYQTVKVNNQYTKPDLINTNTYTNTVEDTLVEGKNLTGFVKKYNQLDQTFIDNMALASK